jgi:hypothetical protein
MSAADRPTGGKASYMLSTVPCLALLAAAGLERPMAHRRARAVVAGVLTCWASTSYLA